MNSLCRLRRADFVSRPQVQAPVGYQSHGINPESSWHAGKSRQLRPPGFQRTPLSDERCTRLGLIAKDALSGLCSPGFARQQDRHGIAITRPSGVTTVRCHVGPVSNPITSFDVAGRRTPRAVEERTLEGASPQVQNRPTLQQRGNNGIPVPVPR